MMNRVRRKHSTYNDVVVEELMKKHRCSRDYILKSIRGDRTGTKSTMIQDEYRQLDRASRLAIENKIKKL